MNRAKAKRQHFADDRQEPAIDEPKRPTLLSGRFILLGVMILLVAGGIVGLSLSVPKKRPPAAAATTQPFFSGRPIDLAGGINNPSPWQYDPVTDRYWNPSAGHNHWEPGRPPQNPGAATTTAGSTFSSGDPAIVNPEPWQYDPVTDKHWVATVGHNHWHSGRPPQNPGATTTTAGPTFTPSFNPTSRPSSGVPAIADPQPWQYDPVTNKYWDPRVGHAHWHAGQPPPFDQREATPPKVVLPAAPGKP